VPGDAVAVDEFDEVAGLVEREGGLGEVGILGEEVFGAAVEVGEVAASAAGDKDLAADLAVVFEEGNAPAAQAGDGGAHEARRSGAEDEDVELADEGTHGLSSG